MPAHTHPTRGLYHSATLYWVKTVVEKPVAGPWVNLDWKMKWIRRAAFTNDYTDCRLIY